MIGARAIGPLLAGIAGTAFGGYVSVFVTATLLCFASAVTLVLAHQAHRREVSSVRG